MTTAPAVSVRGLAKSFTLHAQGPKILPVLRNLSLDVWPGECVVLDGPSGSGKSTLLRMLYGNYLADAGAVRVRHDGTMIDLATAPPRLVLQIRRRTLGHVSQFLRAIPRVAAIDLVAEPVRTSGLAEPAAQDRAAAMLRRVALPERLWHLPPATFSGGEQQRVNIARGLVLPRPILLIDEPTASLDATNARHIASLLHEAREFGCAIVAICHDSEARAALATRLFPMAALEEA